MSLTGRNSKLARLVEEAISNQSKVEVELCSGEVLYGSIKSYELSPVQFFVVLNIEKNVVVINFREVVRMRLEPENISERT